MFSIIIPTLNNLDYLKLCIKSLRINSSYNHQIIPHVNIGQDGTVDFLEKENIEYTFTKHNAGICEGMNMASKKAKNDFILYAHDDFYFCPEWDLTLKNEIDKIGHNRFYLSGIMMNNGPLKFDCGDSLENFNESKLLENYKNINHYDFQGSTWAPHLIHKDFWNKIGGFSEEFYPGTGSDPDLNMKLWNEGVRIYKGINNCKVYHFGSIVTRNYKDHPTIQTESGNKGAKIFILKWGISIDFFKRFYLRSDTKYKGELDNPKISLIYLINLFLCKLNYFYIRFIYRKYNKIRLSKK
jgi:Predicted glycosyltransferases